MPDLHLDFGDGVKTTPTTGAAPIEDKPDITGTEVKPGGEDITGKDNSQTTTTTTTASEGTPATTPEDKKGEGNDETTDSSTGGLEAGTVIEFEGAEYKVAENGDVVDKDGNVFKKADEVKGWLEENEQVDDNSLGGTSIKDVIETIGVEVKDENGNDIEFTDDKEGLKSYFDSVVQLKVNEASQAVLNKFFNDNPIIKQFNDYLVVNNGSPVGFGQIPDRSGIIVNKEDERQQEAIIRTAAVEFGNKSLNDAYIKYLKDSGGLYDEAVNQLQALIDKDKDVRARIETEANMQREAEAAAVRTYWENVNNVIKSRNIAGYKIPESFTREVNGQKIALTPNDFYEYLYKANQVDADGNKVTGYQRDLNKMTDDEVLNKDLLDAWLMFTGGTYKDLVSMAIKEHEVHKLVVKSRQNRTNRTIKISKPASGGTSDVIFE